MDPEEFKKKIALISNLDVEKASQQFKFYYDEMIKTNQKYNLTRITEIREAYLKHFYDSIIPALNFSEKIFEGSPKICDLGTGAGLPGIPLKIIYPDVKLSLLDSSRKKLQFLQNIIDQMNLVDVECVWNRAENYGQNEGREKFDIVVSRAVANLRTLSEYCLPLVKTGGYFIAYKGKNGHSELTGAQDLITLLGGSVKQVIDVKLLQDDESRTLFLIQKEKITPKKYPRPNSVIKAEMKGYHAK